jgi:hypothetical protein
LQFVNLKAGQKIRFVIFLLAVALPILACNQLGFLPTATALPQPTELALTPLPEASQLGGLEVTYVSAVSIGGMGDERCYKLVRFYADGLALFADNVCLEAPLSAENLPDVQRWFRRENQDVSRGDYFLVGQRIWVRIVGYDDVYENIYLRSFEGKYCGNKMVLQEPAVRWYAGIPSDLTQPVVEYNSPETSAAPAGCRVAGFRFLTRPSVVLAGGQANYVIQTDPGERCTLTYTTPDGISIQDQGTGTITADDQGICSWIWELGEQPGIGTVTVSINEITQDLSIEVR